VEATHPLTLQSKAKGVAATHPASKDVLTSAVKSTPGE